MPCILRDDRIQTAIHERGARQRCQFMGDDDAAPRLPLQRAQKRTVAR
jgi:hypothetical protein